MGTRKPNAEEIQAAREELREILSPGAVVHVLQRHVAKSGMTRWLDLYSVGPDGLRRVTETAATAMGDRTVMHDGLWTIKVGGCGMDMHFHTVYGLSRSLWPDGVPCTGERSCTSNDHSNDWGTFARQYDDEHQADAGARGAATHDERVTYVSSRSEWVSHQIDKSYGRKRMHSDGGYALNYRTI